jgi:iron complex transport system substrate-binding protein
MVFFSCTGNRNTTDSILEDSIGGDTIQNDYAESFRIIEHSESTEIQILNSTDNTVEFNYYFKSSVKNENVLKLNPDRVVALSATHIGMMEELDLLDRIVGISSDKYLCSKKLKNRVNEGSVKSIGDIGMADIEGYIAVKPDLVFYSGFDTEAPVLKKLKAAQIETFTNYDWKETHPLGRAEWLKVFGVIFNKRKMAERLFNDIKSKYLSLVEEVKDYSAKDTVLVGTMYGDVFNAPAGDSYMAKILDDAKLNYKYQETKGTGSISLTLEEVISNNRKTNIWLNVAAQSIDKVLVMNSRFRLLESIQHKKVFSYFHEVNCFWEKSAIKPHLLLQDICKITYPDEFHDEVFTFYKKLN